MNPLRLALFCALILATAARADSIIMRDVLLLGPLPAGRRAMLNDDPVERARIDGALAGVTAGHEVKLAAGSPLAWASATADESGAIEHECLQGNGYVLWRVEVPKAGSMLLDASGHMLASVNGELYTGDVYGARFAALPVWLREGSNEILFNVRRGRVQAALHPAPATVAAATGDRTLPDLIRGEAADVLISVAVVNPLPRAVRAALVSAADGVHIEGAPLHIAPCSLAKLAATIRGIKGDADAIEIPVRVRWTSEEGAASESEPFTVRLAAASESAMRRVTFQSRIDRSVQYYALLPAARSNVPLSTPPGLILSLHGASVEATSQAGSYQPKVWASVAAPTNRRPYGFDWEDWGRIDALEVLSLAMHATQADPSRVWLTGHSMGGHGTWQLGAHYPDRFAAIAPSAGWVSMFSYGGAARPETPSPMEALLLRSGSGSDTLALEQNYAARGIYILHGDADDNVPVTEARTMRQRLGGFHTDFAYYERRGAGHWWGNECLDWPPLMDFLNARSRPDPSTVTRVDFRTAHPGISSTFAWATIHQASEAMKPSRVTLQLDRAGTRLEGSTENVRLLHLAPPGLHVPLAVTLDGSTVTLASASGWLRRDERGWSESSAPSPTEKSPHRCGPFKAAIDHGFMFIIGTRGSDEEDAWALAKARYDAQTWWYRGNGSADILTDEQFIADFDSIDRDRSIILYGNADTNAAWSKCIADGELRVGRGGVTVGGVTRSGDLAALFLRPRAGSDVASVAVIGGTTVRGMRLTDRLPTFASGIGYPDLLILAAPPRGVHAMPQIVGGGFFGNDWSAARGEWVWNDTE